MKYRCDFCAYLLTASREDGSGRSLEAGSPCSIFILLFFIMMTNAYTGVFLKTKISVNQLSRATTIGNNEIEKIRNTAYDAIADGKDTIENNFICTWVMDTTITDQNKKGVNLTVEWPAMTKKHSIHFSTIIAK
jgi:hypothetical protein